MADWVGDRPVSDFNTSGHFYGKLINIIKSIFFFNEFNYDVCLSVITVIVDYLLVITLHKYDNIKRLATNICDFTIPQPRPLTDYKLSAIYIAKQDL